MELPRNLLSKKLGPKGLLALLKESEEGETTGKEAGDDSESGAVDISRRRRGRRGGRRRRQQDSKTAEL